VAAKEMIAAQKPKFVVMMIGLNDRKQIREVVPPTRAKPVGPAVPEPADPAARELDRPEPRPETAATVPEPPGSRSTKTYEFRTDAWSEAYIRRIDDTIAALKTAGVPTFWVGLPPLRASRAAADIPFLNDLYRSRADKAGIVYVDVWDGFVDEDGRFAQSGPDFEGQTRRLRAGDGVHFTQAGARKLVHFVEREIDRWLSARAATAALPLEEPKAATVPEVAADAAGKTGVKARPLNGPTVPLTSELLGESDELLGGNARSKITDAVATKVLVNGEAMPVPAGRADDFTWPRRDVAPIGKDPIVTTTDLPMTPMVADRGSTPATAAAAGAAPAATAAAAPVQPARRVRTADYAQYRPDYRRQPFNFFPFLFGGGR
jgi:lysophospholipase L1-like esterase